MTKLIPPKLLLVCSVVMIAIHFLLPTKVWLPFPFNLFGIALTLAGLSVPRRIKKTFDEVQTPINTFQSPQTLVTSGLFQYSRNPIYLGFTIVLIGLWMLLGSSLPLFGVLVFWIAANFWYIPIEEKNMEQSFGQTYLDYKKQVRKWL